MTLQDYIIKYGEKDGLRRWKRNEANKRWQQEHKEYYKEYYKRWQQEHREERLESAKQYRKEHQEERAEYDKQYHQTPYGRALHLINSYRQNDRKYNRGECTLTVKWMVDNIFTRSCLYCGESDWRKLGTDRINNSKPHTIENVVCCCKKCNDKRKKKDILDFAYSIGAKDSDGLVVWSSDTQ